MKDTAIEDLPEQPTGSPDAIALFPDFVLGAMARRGPGFVESVHLDLSRAQPTLWVFHPASAGAVETLAETRHSHFRTILARFAHLCGISPYGGDAELSVSILSFGTRHFSIALCNSQQMGYAVRVCLHAVPASSNSQFDR